MKPQNVCEFQQDRFMVTHGTISWATFSACTCKACVLGRDLGLRNRITLHTDAGQKPGVV